MKYGMIPPWSCCAELPLFLMTWKRSRVSGLLVGFVPRVVAATKMLAYCKAIFPRWVYCFNKHCIVRQNKSYGRLRILSTATNSTIHAILRIKVSKPLLLREGFSC